MAHWLLKSEADSYGWDDLVRDGETEWDGVRNAAAAKHLRGMAVGDSAIFYHSGKDKAAVGIVTVTRTARPDGEDGRWVSVQVAPDRPLPRPVTLAAMKAEARLADLPMLRQSRLSVSPVGEAEWAVLMAMGGI
ncbi:EVE domain-containing protein [Sphingomonas sp. SORGH_AS_0870]|uniref:EVE domain-containing protein n=1 Tax=Sphingomonas sp. SORGH_AS_0870 TaxID=3041801 RepID=UPI00286AFC50|nr:EVE domain-containing protein [Sphingomonas sp. SORGH_AS_0870]